MFNLIKSRKFYSLERPSASEKSLIVVIACPNVVVVVHAPNHVHDSGLQPVLGIVGSLISLLCDAPDRQSRLSNFKSAEIRATCWE